MKGHGAFVESQCQREEEYSEKSCSSATLPTADLKCTGQRWNPTLCSKKPVINSPKYGTTVRFVPITSYQYRQIWIGITLFYYILESQLFPERQLLSHREAKCDSITQKQQQ